MTGIEAAAGRTAAKAGGKLLGAAHRHLRRKKVRRDSRALVAREVADRFLGSLGGERAERFLRYLGSPDFEEVALQLTLWRLLRDQEAGEIEPTLREEIRLGLRHAVGLDPEQLTVGADVVLASLVVAVEEECRGLGAGAVDEVTAAGVAHLAAAAAANTELLRRVESPAAFHSFGERLRKQVAEDHAVIRMPHLGLHRSVPYSQLYVQPSLDGVADLVAPGRRTVVLGDPGAGKSTLAAKLAHDIAVAEDGRVPFLLVLRNFTTSFRRGGKGLAWYLGKGCQEPYNITPPEDAVEYLLGNGRAVVILDGVDELMEPELRQRFARLVESFTRLYPLVPVVVTARKIGYGDAPLDSGLFTTGVISPFDEERVGRYARNWFALSESVPERERPALAEAFLLESGTIGELRSNPLLLALLCNMFAYEHYIPGNLAQVYEKCALMLFEQWDRSRGIHDPLRFQGRLRSAIGYLAWQQFTAPGSNTGWPHGRVVRMLGDFLQRTKGHLPGEAEEEAERFVEFCSGRPWVLTDIGGGREEPRYGFAHRTFMEFFAAEHLVRTRSTPEALWEVLKPYQNEAMSDVVRQLALQQFDRNHEDGASAVLRLAAEGDGHALHMAGQALHYLTPTPAVLRLLGDRLARNAASQPAEEQFRYWRTDEHRERAVLRDVPLQLAWRGLPTNRQALHEAATAFLRRLIRQGDDAAHLAWLRLGLDRSEVADWVNSNALAIFACPDLDLGTVIDRFGLEVLYLTDGVNPKLLNNGDLASALDARTLIEAELPWVTGKWWAELPTDVPDLWFGTDDADLLHLINLPLLESFERHPERFGRIADVFMDLVQARSDSWSGKEVPEFLRRRGVSDEVVDFIDRWMWREFDVIG
ncbi:NACHT domain-containing protein [Saccharothrix xinjiangensis]|uniref:NACHT domain-containing protein n=1 Tax=Saccharothrix xinjiangensis TaxID=204798 RepID=A0ABV9Y8G2_9PSEU